MPTTVTTTAHFPIQSGIVIDCLEWTKNDAPFEALMQEVRSLSGHSPVHVYVRSQLSGRMPRRYTALLQSLGCTVTAKLTY